MRQLLALIVVLALSAGQARAGAQPVSELSILASSRVGDQISLLVRVYDPTTGRDRSALDRGNFQIFEDGIGIAGTITVTETATTVVTPVQQIVLGPEQEPVEIGMLGSTIGIVFDASNLTNRQRPASDSTDYVEAGRDMILAFLESARANEEPLVEAGLPLTRQEWLTLYIPRSDPPQTGEERQPALVSPDADEVAFAEGFVADNNTLINTVISQQARNSKTDLLDTVRLAVSNVGKVANERGSNGYLLIATDGGDASSIGSLEAIVQEALAQHVTILVLGVGPQAVVTANTLRLTTLAEQTGGKFLVGTSAETVAELYRSEVAYVGASLYTLSYTTAQPDGSNHTVTIRAANAEQSAGLPSSRGAPPDRQAASDLANRALWRYLAWAVPIALIVALVCSYALTRRRGGLGPGLFNGRITRH